MKKNKGKIISIILIILSLISIGISTYAHSGRTDSSGGHRDNNNKSGLGSYHYHCGGHPAHLHKNGVCPYSSNTSSKSNKSSSSSTKSSSNSKSSSSSKKTTSTKVTATKIQINESVENIIIGESKKLTATITPSNVSNKKITWKSSNTNIASINEKGEITGKKSGSVYITASTNNGKTSTIKIDIKEKEQKEKVEINNIIKTYTTTSNEITNEITNDGKTTNNNNQEEFNPIGVILALGVLGGVIYLTKKH